MDSAPTIIFYSFVCLPSKSEMCAGLSLVRNTFLFPFLPIHTELFMYVYIVLDMILPCYSLVFIVIFFSL